MGRAHLFAAFLTASISASGAARAADVAADEVHDVTEISLDELMNPTTRVAGTVAQSLGTSPAIVSVITGEELQRLGVRDLRDALNLFASFQLGSDESGAVGAGLRGMWTQEGKLLLLVDGQAFNELLYLSIQLGNHLPISQIERIEIIRGPGSAIYGGYAELGVVNIVTRSGASLGGLAAEGMYGQSAHTFMRRNMALSFGDRIPDGEYSIAAFVGQGQLSDQTYTDALGDAFNMTGNAYQDPLFFNLGGSYRGLKLRFIYDGYHTTDRTVFGVDLPYAVPVDFNSYHASAHYELRVTENLTVAPALLWTQQSPWRTVDTRQPVVDSGAYYDKTATRITARLAINWTLMPELSLALGGEQQADNATMNSAPPGQPLIWACNGPSITFNNLAVFAEATSVNSIVNVTAGARYEDHSKFGSSFVPRAALTREIGPVSLKALYSRAFKTPGLENIGLNPAIKPEHTQVYELAASYRLTDNMRLDANLFDIKISNPIIFGVTADGQQTYVNGDATGSRGVELEYTFKYSGGFANAAYTFYDGSRNAAAQYSVPGHSDLLLGMAAHKANIAASIDAGFGVYVSPSLVYQGQRFAMGALDTNGNATLLRLPPVALANLFVGYRNIGGAGIEAGVGFYNIFGAAYLLPQAYNAGHPPLPTFSREVMLRIGYALNT